MWKDPDCRLHTLSDDCPSFILSIVCLTLSWNDPPGPFCELWVAFVCVAEVDVDVEGSMTLSQASLNIFSSFTVKGFSSGGGPSPKSLRNDSIPFANSAEKASVKASSAEGPDGFWDEGRGTDCLGGSAGTASLGGGEENWSRTSIVGDQHDQRRRWVMTSTVQIVNVFIDVGGFRFGRCHRR